MPSRLDYVIAEEQLYDLEARGDVSSTVLQCLKSHQAPKSDDTKSGAGKGPD